MNLANRETTNKINEVGSHNSDDKQQNGSDDLQNHNLWIV